MNLNLDQLFERAYQKRQLLYASFELTYNCNFACKFCYNPVFRPGQNRSASKVFTEKQLSLDEYIKIFDRLREGGVIFVTFTGGEALVHPNFWEILEEARKRHFCIRLFSNGSMINRDVALKLKEKGVFCVEISIYGASKETYQKLTGRAEGFEKAWQAVSNLKEANVVVYLKCILSKFTENEMDEIQDMADKKNVILRWDHLLSPSEDGLDYPLKYTASEKSIERLFTDSKFKAGSSPFERGEGESICVIGRTSVHIDPFGNINPCVEWKEPIGNIRRDDIFEVWQNSPRLKELMKISEEVAEKVKRVTTASEYCFNCMGRSRLVYNDPYKIEPCEIKVAELRKMVAEKSKSK